MKLWKYSEIFLAATGVIHTIYAQFKFRNDDYYVTSSNLYVDSKSSKNKDFASTYGRKCGSCFFLRYKEKG